MATATITSKGQITVPKNIRDHMHVDKGDRVEFLLDDQGVVTIWPVTAEVITLKGMVPKPRKPVSIQDMNSAIEESGGRR
ncbi:MAG: AbrB family transcriptional regulator [Deltaproteobacteria bacterium CG_4_10_14_3_um_filter_60_8]|nr:MAG: AbrB family transcriptional regulator [Desulfobacterales bacterium CG2_30_60_27]PIP44134.1 MAG: AbrB family transcriptional regulator [Deltaproteobacteria bacterium CG23_combo_of_CG06-09_8_20_14_all_60_8]PIY21301.1 MAG: AbrB family transcriptional regulator [Deltaproteobacteria bacterium CG_4_10_14_3_um_filter_60_8]